jgi:lysophospholipase L1-like esterase
MHPPRYIRGVPLRLASFLACTAMLALMAVAPANAERARYYLSLGDSLAQGMQPDSAGLTINTNQGYADQLYAIEKRKIPGLKLVKLGCGRFLREHRRRGEVALLTLDASCVIRGAEHISANLPVIMRRLRRAAAPGTPMASMTLYNPFLELYLTPGGQAEAIASDEYARNVNEGLARLYRAGGFRVAHVDVAFRTYDLSMKTSLAGQPDPVPVAVAEVCRLTWMCAPAPVGPNIHANPAGYGLIAQAFATAFGSG